MSEYIYRFGDPRAQVVDLVGGKGASLAILSTIDGVTVPEGFIVNVYAYDDFVNETGLVAQINKLDEITGVWSKADVITFTKDIRDRMISTPMPAVIEDQVFAAYELLSQECRGVPDLSLAVRSSAPPEDSTNASFAGQMDSFLNQRTDQQILSSLVGCWVSVFGDRVVDYRNQLGLSHASMKQAVVILRMINGFGAGVGFNVDMSEGKPGVTIEANYGLGESVVQGTVTPDSWVFDENGDRLLRGKLGNKSTRVVYSKDGGTTYEDVPRVLRERFVFDREEIQDIAHSVKAVGEFYKSRFGYPYIDTEFVVDKSGKLYFVQARPETVLSRKVSNSVTFLDIRNNGVVPIVQGGEPAVHNVATGKAKTVVIYDPSTKDKPTDRFAIRDNPDDDEIQELARRVEPGDILIATKTIPSFELTMRETEGLVTEEGGWGCHTSIIAREFGIPCIVGMTGVIDRMAQFEGQTITMDPFHRAIYFGDLRREFESEGNIVDLLHEQYSDAAIQMSIERLIFELGGESGDHVWFGRPAHKIGGLQMDLYEEAFRRLKDRLGVPLRSRSEVGVFKTPKSDNLVLFKAITELGLNEMESLLEERAEAVRDFEVASEVMNWTPEGIEEFLETYTGMIEHFHMRWIFNRASEVMLKQEMLRYPVELRAYMDTLCAMAIAEDPYQRERANTYDGLLEMFRDNPDAPETLEAIAAYAGKYPRTDSVDLRLRAPVESLKMDLEKDKNRQTSGAPVRYICDAPLEFDEHTLRVIALNAKQAIAKEIEPYVQIGGQFAARKRLMEMGRYAESLHLLEKPGHTMELTRLDLLNLAEELLIVKEATEAMNLT